MSTDVVEETTETTIDDLEITRLAKAVFDDVEVELEFSHRSNEWITEHFPAEEDRREGSLNIHQDMTPERQDFFRERMIKALRWMEDTIDQWLPLSLALDQEGDTISVTHHFRKSLVEDGEALMAQATARDVNTAVEALESDKIEPI